MGGEADRETGGSSVGTEAGGDCAAPSAADGINLNRLTPDESPARSAHQLTAKTGVSGGSGGVQQLSPAAGGQRNRKQPAASGQHPASSSQREAGAGGRLSGDTELLLPPARGSRAATSGGHREASERGRAAAEASGRRRCARRHPGGGHGREGVRIEGGGPRVGLPALRESTGDCGAAAPPARAGSARGA